MHFLFQILKINDFSLSVLLISYVAFHVNSINVTFYVRNVD